MLSKINWIAFFIILNILFGFEILFRIKTTGIIRTVIGDEIRYV